MKALGKEMVAALVRYSAKRAETERKGVAEAYKLAWNEARKAIESDAKLSEAAKGRLRYLLDDIEERLGLPMWWNKGV